LFGRASCREGKRYTTHEQALLANHTLDHLTENEYYTLIKELRTCMSKGEPFWKLEEYWTITGQE
jgi:hypothetical protein